MLENMPCSGGIMFLSFRVVNKFAEIAKTRLKTLQCIIKTWTDSREPCSRKKCSQKKKILILSPIGEIKSLKKLFSLKRTTYQWG